MRADRSWRRAVQQRTHSTFGFSLVELLVVITIIGVLVALLLPAVQTARESARQAQCGNHVKQLALVALMHESSTGQFPTGGWDRTWLGHPDRGFNKRQPGGWIYNVLPFLEQQALHDLGATGTGVTLEDANARRLATPLAGLHCPTRRPAALYRFLYSPQFRLVSGSVTEVARNDYAINGGDYVQWRSTPPPDLAGADNPTFPWGSMSHQSGISHERSEVRLCEIVDGTSNTFLLGEKYVNADHYTDGKDLGDNDTMYCGDDLDLVRFTGIVGTVGTSDRSNVPLQDRPAPLEGNRMQWFGSAHADGFNMSFCDGSVRTIGYAIDAETYRCLGNRRDGQVTRGL
jgi:prepilin-type N-terminal cleavage/methylation domain-containing protein/prepilin-type processing-associated H-X9-DG protein